MLSYGKITFLVMYLAIIMDSTFGRSIPDDIGNESFQIREGKNISDSDGSVNNLISL